MTAEAEYRTTARTTARADEEIIVDLFAGGGGASTGIEAATGRAVTIAVNHDPTAIGMHTLNHPHTRHLVTDVREVDPAWATRGRPVGMLWLSPDCSQFSRAKGSKPVQKNIRSLAWVAIDWAAKVRPRVIFLENVREFEDWGPLDADDRPCKRRKGITFKQWRGRLRGLGYVVEHKVLNAADYGERTNRKRLCLIARCDGKPIVWPEPTHGKGRQPYRTAAECIDWSLPCPSIFLTKAQCKERGLRCKRPLEEKSMRRIAMGIVRFVLQNPAPFIVQLVHGGHDVRQYPIDQPLGTITSRHGHALVTPILVQRNGEAPHQQTRGITVDRPFGAITPREGGGYNLVQPMLHRSEDVAAFLSQYYGQSIGQSINEPVPTQTLQRKTSVVTAMLAKNYGGVVGVPVTDPTGTITAKDHHSLVAANLVKFRFDSNGHPLDEPLPTITAGAGAARQAGAAHALGIAAASMVHFNHGDKQWQGVDEPLRTVTSNNHAGLVYAFLAKYFGTAIGAHVLDPLPTITGKDRFSLVTVMIGGEPWVIVDIGMRMLSPAELAMAQGFPESYVWTGSNATRVGLIGNSVCPKIAEVLVKANYKTQRVTKRRKAVLA